MRTLDIAIYPGDGIGPEVTDEAVRVLRAVAKLDGSFTLNLTTLPWGFHYWEQHGRVVPEDFIDVLRPFDAILLGAVGWPEKLPDHVTLAPLVEIRQTFDQYACVRPAKLLPGVKSVLADKGPEHIDFVVIRENSEGEYVNIGGRFKQGQADEVAVQTALHTRRGVERISAFRIRHGGTASPAFNDDYQVKRTTLFVRHVGRDTSKKSRSEFSDVEVDRQHCDAAVMNMVRMPEHFDCDCRFESIRRCTD